jgi:hypothetical protein
MTDYYYCNNTVSKIENFVNRIQPFFYEFFFLYARNSTIAYIQFYATPKAWMRLEIAKCPQPRGAWMLLCIFLFLFLRASAEGGWRFSAALQWFCKSAFKGNLMNKITGHSHTPTHTLVYLTKNESKQLFNEVNRPTYNNSSNFWQRLSWEKYNYSKQQVRINLIRKKEINVILYKRGGDNLSAYLPIMNCKLELQTQWFWFCRIYIFKTNCLTLSCYTLCCIHFVPKR